MKVRIIINYSIQGPEYEYSDFWIECNIFGTVTCSVDDGGSMIQYSGDRVGLIDEISLTENLIVVNVLKIDGWGGEGLERVTIG